MTILIDKDTKTMVQGITGKNAAVHTGLMLEYGTDIVAGVTPGKGGQDVHGKPVYDTVKECVENHPEISLTSIWVPARFTRDAVLEAMDAGLRTIVIITETIPIHDMLLVRKRAKEMDCTILGGNTPGLISPGRAVVGMLPVRTFTEGRIGIAARSGSLLYYVANYLDHAGLGESTAVGMGGDPIIGTNFDDLLRMFEEDPGTDAVVMHGEIGGVLEEMAAPYIQEMSKPVVGYITGRFAPAGKRMGHAGALIEGGQGTAASKIEALERNGARVAETISDIPRLLKELL
jgi:succinyl-CoA synthetase alpha subunit